MVVFRLNSNNTGSSGNRRPNNVSKPIRGHLKAVPDQRYPGPKSFDATNDEFMMNVAT